MSSTILAIAILHYLYLAKNKGAAEVAPLKIPLNKLALQARK